MSFYRKAFLVWWTALVLFIAAFLYVNWDVVPTSREALIGFTIMTLALLSWLPHSLLWRRR